MSYEPKDWQCGDVITAEDLNRMEQGIAQGGGGSALEVNVSWDERGGGTLDKTWQEIDDAFPNAYVMSNGVKIAVNTVGVMGGQYGVVVSDTFVTDDPNGYPRTGGIS